MGSIDGYPESKWNIIEYIGNGKVLCRCDCGVEKIVDKYSVTHGKTLSCGCSQRFKPLKGRTINYWTVLEDIDKDYALCKCICGKVKNVQKAHLNNGSSKSCGCITKGRIINSVGNKYNYLTVIEELGNSRIKCQCICGNIKDYNKYHVQTGAIKSCGCMTVQLKSKALLNDLTNTKINSWTILEELGKNRVRCLCDCGNIKVVQKTSIINKTSKSCGHDLMYKDIIDKQIYNWTVLDDNGYGLIKCRCKCGTIKVIEKPALLSGKTKSCGCLKYSNYLDTMTKRYNEIVTNKINAPRSKEQLEYIVSKGSLKNAIDSHFEYKPTIYELTSLLGVNEASVGRILKRLDAYDLIYLKPLYSRIEKELYEYIKSIYEGTIIENDRKILNGKELDIYIPDKKLAIEFNGTYWHSDIFRDRKYHQNKTIDCAKQGIRLIHIFEHEWDNIETQNKLKNLLKNILQQNDKILYGRKLEVKYIEYSESSKFINEYHISCSAISSVNIGLFDSDTLVGVMTFGKPRFNDRYEWELIRLCFKPGYSITGGKEKMFSKFISDYKPKSIITYSDISKFTGNSYLKLGFKPIDNAITEPNYVWVSADLKNILSRYQTQKSKLIDLGLGTSEQTEDDIMTKLNYLKIYDAGNLKLEWVCDN